MRRKVWKTEVGRGGENKGEEGGEQDEEGGGERKKSEMERMKEKRTFSKIHSNKSRLDLRIVPQQKAYAK